jgi:hypothetical protein
VVRNVRGPPGVSACASPALAISQAGEVNLCTPPANGAIASAVEQK